MSHNLTKWTPTTNLTMLRRMGKLIEELNELGVVAARCIIQGIDDIDPGSGLVNRERLEKELADVMAQCIVTIEKLGLNQEFIKARTEDKTEQMAEWEAMFPPADAEPKPVFVVDHIGSSYGEGPNNSTVIVGHSATYRALVRGAKLYEAPNG